MDKKDIEKKHPSNDGSEQENTPINGDRRNAIKKTITLGGASIVATEWTRPIVETVILPAHALTSPGTIAIITI